MLSKKTQTILRKLTQKKYRKKMFAFIVEGKKGVKEAMMNANVLMIIVDGKKSEDAEIKSLITKAENSNIIIEYLGRKDIDLLSSTETFPGIMAIVKMLEPVYDEIFQSSTILILDRISDPGNLGTIIRTADWFGVKTIVIRESSVDPYNEKVVRSTMGSIFRINIVETDNILDLVEKLKKNGYSISALDLYGSDIKDARKFKKQVLIFGSESHGLSDELKKSADYLYTIEGKGGGAESLNLAISVGIVLFKFS